MANGRDRDRDRDDKEKKKKRKRPSDQPVSTAVREALRTLPPPTPAPRDVTTVARAPAAGRVLSQTFFERALREGRTQEQAPDYTRAYGVPRESLELPGVRPSVSPLSPPPSGPTRAGAYLEERYGHLRHTTPRLPQPGLVSEILALPGRAIRPLAEPIGRYVGATPEHERAIARFIRELGEPQPIPNPVERLTRGLSPETRQRIGRAMVTLSGIPALTEALSAGTELAGRALDAIVPEPVEEFARETLRSQGAQWALASPEMRRGRPLPVAIGALTGAMAGGWPGALAGALLGGLVDWEAPAAALAEQFYAASGRPREEFEALFPGGRPPRITTTDRLLAELLDPLTFLPGGVGPSAIANALSAAARPWSYEDESSALERALGAAVGTPAAIRGFEAGARALGEAARGAVGAGRALARPVMPALEQAWRLGREAIETAEAERAVRREVDNLAQLANLARARGNEAAAQAIERELVRVATSIEPATPFQRALLAGRDVAGLASAAGLAAAATAVSGEQPGIEGERPATEQEAVTRPGEQARRFAAADTGAQPLVTPGALLTGLAAGAAGYALGRRRGGQERRRLARLAQVDELTGLANRRAFEAARPTADRSPDVEYLLLDLQNFKAVNDKLGLAAGDAELRKVADALRQAAREVVGTDERVFRFGGDEFAVLAPKGQGEAILQRARELYPGIDVEGYRTGIRGVIADTFDAADARMKAVKEGEGPRYRALPALAVAGAFGATPAAEDDREQFQAPAAFPALAATLAGMGLAPGPRFYSRLRKRIEEGPARATVAQWRKHLEQGTSKAEREWTGVQAFLDALDPNARLTREELLQAFRSGEIRLRETILSYDAPAIREAEEAYQRAQQAYDTALDALISELERAGYNREQIDRITYVRPDTLPGPVPAELLDELRAAASQAVELLSSRNYLGYRGVDEALDALAQDPDPIPTYNLPETARPIVERFRAARAAVREAEGQPVDPRVAAAYNEYLKRHTDYHAAIAARTEAYQNYKPRYGSGGLVEPGGENYREILITLDDPRLAEPFTHQHWPGVTNVVAHTRVKDRYTLDGERALHVEEIQSDWAEMGRDKEDYGWRPELEREIAEHEKRLRELSEEEARLKRDLKAAKERYEQLNNRYLDALEIWYAVVDSEGNVLARFLEDRQAAVDYQRQHAPTATVQKRFVPTEEAVQVREEIRERVNPEIRRLNDEITRVVTDKTALQNVISGLRRRLPHAVPHMPFRRTEDWAGLVIKRLIDEAVRGGYDVITWSPGRVQADRYNLRRLVNTILYNPNTQHLIAFNQFGSRVFDQKVEREKVASYIGKELTERLFASPLGKGQVKIFPIDEWPQGSYSLRLQLEDPKFVVAVRDPEDGHLALYGGARTRTEAEELARRAAEEKAAFHVLEGSDLEIGGQGMIAFYDTIVPNLIKEYARKAGVNIKLEEFPLDPRDEGDWYIEHTAVPLTAERIERAVARIRGAERPSEQLASEPLIQPSPAEAIAREILEEAANNLRWGESVVSADEALKRALATGAVKFGENKRAFIQAVRLIEHLLGGSIKIRSAFVRPGFRISEALKRKVLAEGQPLLSIAAPAAGAALAATATRREEDRGEQPFPAIAATVAGMGIAGRPWFYSRLEKRIEEGPARATVAQWRKHLEQGVSKVEREWTGVQEMLARLDPNAMLTKEELLSTFRLGRLRMNEVVLSHDAPQIRAAESQYEAAQAAAAAARERLTETLRRAGYDADEIQDVISHAFFRPPAPVPRALKEELETAREDVRQLVRRLDHLGYDFPGDAIGALLRDPDPMRTFDLPEEARPIIERFRSAHAAVEEARNQPVSPEVLAALEDYRNRRDEVSRAHQRLSEARSDYLPQYHSYAEPGGKNYREILITFDHPSLLAPFERSHWHVPNVVGHARVTDRQTIDGQRILYVEEIQSDWAEKGRKSKEYGWRSEVRQQRRDAEKQLADVRHEISRLKQEDAEYRARLRELDERIQRGTEGRYEVVAPDGTVLASYPEAERLSAYEYRETRAPEASVRYTPVQSPDAEAALQQRAELLQSYWPVRNRLRELEEKEPELNDLVRSLWHQEQFLAVPDMPFRQTEDWVGLVMKRLIDEAVRGGYDALVWAPGDVHVDRYGLRGWARTLLYDPDNHILLALNADGRNFFRQKVKPDKLPDYVGKEVAERLLAQPRGKGEVEVFTTDEWEELGGRADPWFGDEPDEPYVIAKRDPETGEFEGVATAATREEAEEKVAQLESDRPRFHVLPRTNVEVGGEGMYAFYDKILPTWLKNYARKSGLDIQIEDFYLEPPYWSDVLLSYEGPALTLERLQEAAGRLRAEPGPSTADAQTLLETAIAFVGPNYRRLPESALEEAVRRRLAAPYLWQMPRLQEALRTLERALGGRLRLVSREARPGFRITETIRRKVLEEGQPLLSVAAPIAGALTASGAASEGAEEAQSSQQAGKPSLAAAMAFMRPGRGRRRLIANVELTSNNDPRMVRFGELPAKVQERFTRRAIREILRPIARSEGLSTRIVVGLGSWFEEGSFAVQRAGRYAFPANTPDETVHRVLSRASLALKQSGYFAARPEPGTERWAIEVDFGRSLSPEEYIRHVEAMSQDAPTFRGTTMVSLSPARVQIVLDEGLGRDAVQQTIEHIAARLPDDYIITGDIYEVRTVEGYGEDWFLQVLDRRGLSEEQARVDREVHQRFDRLANDVADATRRFLGSGGPGESGLRGLGAFALLPAAGALASSSEGSDEELPVLAATSIPAGFRLRILADPLAHQLWTRLRVLPPPAGQPILPHLPADAQRAILDALVNLRVARPGVTLAEAEQILRQLPQDQLRGFFEHVFPLLPTTQRMAAASAFPLPSPRYQAQPSASGAGSASPGFSWLAGQGYPLGPEYHISLAASPSRGEDLVFEAGKPEGVSPGAIFRDPYSGQQVLVKGASIIENPEAEAFVDRLSRALFTGLVPTVESEVVRGREAQELAQQVPFPVVRRALELGAQEGGLYVRPFFPLRKVETLWGEVTYGFPMAPTDAEIADALRAALIGRTVANVDLHAGNIAAFQGGRAGTIDAGLAFGRLATDPVVKSQFTAELFRQIITGRPIIPDAPTESVDVEAALRPLADRVRQLTRTDIERIGREALQAIRNWRVFRSEFSDPAMQDQARQAFERRLAELPDLIDRIIQAWRDAQQYPAGSPPRERIWRNLANAVKASAPIMAAAILADGFMTDEELWAADKAGLTGIVASLLPAGARRRFLKAVEDRATTAADRVLSRIDYSGMPAGERPTLSYQALRAYTYAIDRLAPIGRVTTEAARELGYQERRGFLSRLVRGAEKGREQLPFRLDAETLARAAAGWQGYAAEVLERGVHLPGAIGETKTRGLNQILAEVGALPNVKLGAGTYTAHQALDAYRVAKRALELEDPARPGGPRKTGIDLDAARELVEQVERDYPDLVRLQRELVAYHDEWLRLLEDEGVLRPGALDQMKAAGNREYTPFFRAGLERRGPTVGGKRLADLPDPVKRLVGSERELLPPSESDIRLTYAYANLLMRQRASNALAEIAEAWPDNPWIRRTRRPVVNVRVAKEQLKGQIDEDLLELIEPDFLSVWVGRRPSPGSNIIAVTREGKRVYYQTDPLLYEAIMGLTPRQMSFAERLLSAPAQWLRTGVTILPDFALANLIRDTVQVAATSEVKGPVLTAMARTVTDMLRGLATLMAASEASTVKRAAKAAAVGATFGALTPTGVGESDQEALIRGIGALAGAAIVGGFGALAPQVSRGFTRSARSRPTARMKPEDLVAAWRSAGGDFAAYLSMDRESLSRSIREAIRQGQRFPIAWTPADAIRVLRAVNETLENANRMGEFLRQIDVAGQADVGTITRAAVAARDVSVDFKRHGLSRIIEVIRSLTTFWNPRIQGVDKIVRAFVKDPRRTSAVLMISVTLPSLALWAINRDNPDYWEIPLWQRNLFWLVPIGTTTLEDGQKQTVFLRIPKPFELGILFGSLPERMVEAFDPKNPHRGGGRQIEDQAWEQFVGEVAGMFSPVPTAVQPWLEIWLNRDLFTGRTIHSIFEPEDMDPRLKGRDRASEVARLFSDVLNDVADSMDGTAIIRKFADFLRLSPAEVDHLFSSYLGGAGRLAVNTASRALRDEATRGPAPAGQLADAPLTGRFVARTPPPTSESEAQFGELWRRAQGLRATVTRWLEAGRPDDALRAIDQDPALFAAYESLRRTAEFLSRQRRFERLIEENPGMTAEEKRRTLDVIYRLNAEMSKAALDIYRIQREAMEER